MTWREQETAFDAMAETGKRVREGTKADVLFVLSSVLNDLPKGHPEKPGLIRAIELMRHEVS